MKRNMSIFLALVLVLSVTFLPVFAEENSKGGGNVVPDIHLREAINEKLGFGYVDDDVTREQVESLTDTLFAFNRDVHSIEGLQYAINLNGLDISSNEISDINPISGLTNLEVIYLDNNKIVDISPLSTLTNLNFLSLSNNKIHIFNSLSGLTNLEHLNAENNIMMSTEFLTNLINLKYLYINRNKYVSHLDSISNLSNLEILNISSNPVRDIEALNNLKKLSDLDFSHTFVSDLEPLKALNIRYLKFSGARVKDIRILRTLPLLETLDFSANRVCDISPIKNLHNLYVVNFNDNNVSDLSPLRDWEGVMGLGFANNNVSDLSPLSNLKYGTLDLSGNRVRDISALSSDISFKAENQRIEMVLDSPYEFEVEEVSGYYNEILDVSHLPSEVNKNGEIYTLLTETSDLTWSKDYEPDSDFGKFSGKFSVYNSDTGDVVPDKVLKERINYELGRKPLSAPLSISDLESLTGELHFRIISLDATPIDKIESVEGLQYATNIDSIHLGGNKVTDISPLKDLELDYLKANNQIVELVLDSPHEFESEIISKNGEVLDLSYSPSEVSKNGDTYKLLTDSSSLTWDYESDPQIGLGTSFSGVLEVYTSENGSVIPDKNLRKAINKKLGKEENDASVSKAEVESLEGSLDAYCRNIYSIEGLQNAGNITSLILSHNNISDIEPLRGLSGIKFLDFSNNNVEDINALETLASLHTLLFNKNQVSDLTPLRNFDFFYALRFNENRVSDISPLNVNNYIGEDQKIEKYLDSPYEFESELIGINGDVLELSYLPEEISKDGDTYKLLSENSKLTWSEIVNPNTEKFSGILNVYRNVSSQFEMKRLSGKTRYDTAVEVSKEMYNSADNVIIVNGRKYPDALSSTPLAKLYSAPILLVKRNEVPASTKEEIERLGASKAIIVGGKGVVSNEVASELEGMGLTVERYSGKDRYKTALAVAEKVAGMSDGTNLILVKGTDFPDALTVTSLALKEEIPILLTNPNVLGTEVQSFIEEQSPSKLYIAGGKGAVSLEIESDIEDLGISVTRFSGKDRYETGKEIAEYVYPSPKEIIFANGRDFADAMVGGPLTTVNGGPVMLVGKNHVPQATKDYMVPSTIESVYKAYIVGGKGVVSEGVKTELTGILD